MNQDELFAKIAREIIRSMAISMLKSKEISKDVASSGKKEEIEKNIDKITDEITRKFLENLRRKTSSGEEISEKEFKLILEKTVKEFKEQHFGGLAENKNKA